MPLPRQRVTQWVKFLAVGLPAFLLAVPANYALVEFAGTSKGTAYAFVLVGQITMNFFMCRWLVFEKMRPSKWYHDFAAFFTGILLIRVLDWVVYVLLVHQLGLYYLAAQILNVLIFSVLKFLFSERVMT